MSKDPWQDSYKRDVSIAWAKLGFWVLVAVLLVVAGAIVLWR